MARRRRSGFDDWAGRARGHGGFGGGMRALIACVLLAACATGSTLSPAQRLAGCWINRDAGAARMRWSESPDSEGAFLGSKTSFGIAGANTTERYSLAS